MKKAIAMCMLLSGCGTSKAISDGHFGFYSGVGYDMYGILSSMPATIACIIDLPFSLVMDTLMIPILILDAMMR